MHIRLAATSLMFWMTTSIFSEAMARGDGRHSAPEIDGPGGVAAVALLVGAGLIAYNRYKRK